MARHHFVVLSNPVTGREDEYNDWYSNQHLDDVLQVPGFVAAQRFRLAAMNPAQESLYGYLCIYEVESDDLDATKATIEAAAEGMVISGALDQEDLPAWYFTPITDRKTAE